MKTIALLGYALQACLILGAIGSSKMNRGIEGLPTPLEKLHRELGLITSGPENAGLVMAGWLGSSLPAVVGMLIFSTYLWKKEKRKEGAGMMAFGLALCAVMVFWPLVL